MAEIAHEPVSLLEVLQQGSGFEAALLTTFNAYFPFLEEVVLRRLRALGCHYIVTLIDSAQLATELADRVHRPLAAGRRYGLLPVERGAAFHPKISLLVGPRAARVVIGSHNLTMSGFVHNREVTNVIDVRGPKDRVGAGVIIEVLEFCRAWTSDLSPPLQRTIDDFRDLCRPYFGPVPRDGELQVLGSRPEGPSLWQQVRRLLPAAASRIALIGPFFDNDLSFVHRVNEDLRPDEIIIGVDPNTACFPGNTQLPRGVRVVDAQDLDSGHEGRGYLHAKAMLIEGTSERILITGSANPTAPAWLAPVGARNAEIVVVRRLPLRGCDALGLPQLWKKPPVPSAVLAELRSRPDRPDVATGVHAPLIGICQGTRIHVNGTFEDLGSLVVRDYTGGELPSKTQKEAAELIIDVAERVHDASLIEAVLDGEIWHGLVHHAGLLRELAVSSSQRRLREALRGLDGDPSQLEGLLRLVEKVIFDAPPVDTGVARKGRIARDKDEHLDEPGVVVVGTLKKGQADERRRLSTGDVGLLLDYLMRKLWRSLAHEPVSGMRSEAELINSDDKDIEDILQQLPADPEIAEAWHRKSRTLLRRLARRIEEGKDAPQIVIETAAVLGVLEALRRVEDQDRWRALRVEFVDRDQATEFVFNAIPRLFMQQSGLLDLATKAVGGPFPEQEGVIQWTTWLAWLTGFGPSEVWKVVSEDEDDDDERHGESDRAIEVAERLARACLIGARAGQVDSDRIIELLQAAPFPGTDPRTWLDSLTRFGEAFSKPADALLPRRPPRSGDLVVLDKGGGPFVVRCVREDKVDLIAFGRKNNTVTFLASKVRVLDAGLDLTRNVVGY